MIAAVTGSRYGLSNFQQKTLIDLFCENPLTEFHYGDCLGVDEQAMWLWVACGSGVGHSHPATMSPDWDARWRARTAEKYPELGIIEHEAKHPLERNRDMVDIADVLWAFPNTSVRQLKGGTWYTIDYAEKKGVRVLTVMP